MPATRGTYTKMNPLNQVQKWSEPSIDETLDIIIRCHGFMMFFLLKARLHPWGTGIDDYVNSRCVVAVDEVAVLREIGCPPFFKVLPTTRYVGCASARSLRHVYNMYARTEPHIPNNGRKSGTFLSETVGYCSLPGGFSTACGSTTAVCGAERTTMCVV